MTWVFDMVDAAPRNTVIAVGFVVLVLIASVDVYVRRRWRS